MSSENRLALRDLRRTRQRRRLGDTEWFDVAYRVYLFGLGGLIAVVLASDAINGFIGEDVTTDDVLTRGPSIVGIAVVVAFGLGLRSGADGGPISIEVADIRHVLLAPIDRRSVMLRPITQRMRSVMFTLGLTAAVLGQLVARELEGSRAAWAAAGAAFGSLVGAVFVATAVIAHALRIPRWVATGLGSLGVAWQCATAWTIWDGQTTNMLRFGPANLAGSLAMWGIRQRGIDLVAAAIGLAALLIAVLLGGRLRLEPLARRGELVSQLRFAATVQDLRTVVMLRRQLRAETLRARPWGRRSRSSSATRPRRLVSPPQLIWVRGLRSLRRLPASRLGRIVTLSIMGGVSASLTVSSSPLFAFGTLASLFLLGMEAIEPLSQEVDRPDITDSLPTDRGMLFVHHLVAPGALLVVAGLIGAAATAIVEPSHVPAALALAIPVVWAGAIGPVVGTVLDAPAPISVANTTITGAARNQESTMIPPEFAGFTHAFSTFLPIVLSALGVLPVLAMRVEPGAGTAFRSAVGIVLALSIMTSWIRRRDRWGMKIREFFAAGRAQQTGVSPS